MDKRGFSVIESLVSVAIIGLLAAMAVYVTMQAQRQSRDAKRKSDLAVISLAFETRYLSRTCSDLGDAGFYPGHHLAINPPWKPVATLRGSSDGCGAFSEYLSSVPEDPKYNVLNPYRFDLSSESGLVGKHFRLAAMLEKVLTSQEAAELDRMERSWTTTFNGGTFPSGYTYVTGK